MSEPFVGEITMFAGNFAPRGWAFCDGQLLPIAQNQSLYSLLGTTYGGDGRTTFGLPDLRGRFPLHPGSGAGLPSYSLGQRGGAEQQVLTVAQLPPHAHTTRCHSGQAITDYPEAAYPAIYEENAFNTSSTGNMLPSNNTGDGQSFNIRNPFLASNFLIALQGVFPSRN